jgi:UDP-N-acetylmuramyl pentapeptide phosphotransferase/UDP-N-acetylglucosamine-1-phosphate transferase
MPAMSAGLLISFVVAFGTLHLLLSRFARFGLDEPNARSLHHLAVPRTGGIAIVAGLAASVPFVEGLLAWAPLLGAAALAAVSLCDDLRGLPTAIRFGSHLGAAGGVVWYLTSPINPFALFALILAVAWITNLYNFMDGSDGLAGGMAVLGFGTYGLAAFAAGNVAMAALCWALTCACIAFLIYNFPPARIFLGDVGSIPLGFLAGSIGVAGWHTDAWPLWFPLLVFGPFIGDATLTLVKRLLRRERVWEAHREHYYQRVVQMGVGHRRTALIAYCVMLACSIAALAARDQTPFVQWLVFCSAGVGLALLAAWIDVRWRRYLRLRGTA